MEFVLIVYFFTETGERLISPYLMPIISDSHLLCEQGKETIHEILFELDEPYEVKCYELVQDE